MLTLGVPGSASMALMLGAMIMHGITPGPLLRARQGDHSGSVKLYASVALLVTGKGGRFFNWEYSLDGGVTWVAAPSTPQSKTTISGLPTLKQVLFRTSVTLTKTGQGPWTDGVSFIVH